MKFKLILALALTALSLSAQTNNPFVDASAVVTSTLQPGKPGTLFVTDANNMLVPLAATPTAPDKVTTVINSATAYLAGILSLLSVLLGWWGKNGSKFKEITSTLIKSVESHGSPDLKKEISRAAGAAGTEPALHKLVQELTPATPLPPNPFAKPPPTVIVPEVKP